MKRKLIILMLSHSSELAGAERSMLDLFDYWAAKDYVEPHFIIRQPVRNLARELHKRGWPYTAIHYTNWSQRNPSPRAEDIYRNALFNTQAVFEIEKSIASLKPDVVMTNTIVAPWAAIAAYFQRLPHIWFIREYGDVDHKHVVEIGRAKMLQDIDTLSCQVVTNSKTLATHISDNIDKSKITPLYTPFDLDALRRKSQERATNPFRSPDSLKLVITGKIAGGKGQTEAVEATARLIKQGYDAELCIIGKAVEPGDDEPLMKLIDKYGIQDKVHLIGHIPNPLAVLKYADVGIMASKQEAFGRVTFEYMAVGLPVVGTDSGATPEMVDEGQNGYLFKPNDADGLTKKLLNYARRRELIKEHGKTARLKAEKMMEGAYNADALFEKVTSAVENYRQNPVRPLNFTHRWLEYPTIARQYIDSSGAISLKRLIYHRLRHKAKLAYIITGRVVRFAGRGFRRNPDIRR